MSISEHTQAIYFFIRYSNDVPQYRTHLLSPIGISLWVKHIKSLHAEINDTDRVQQDIWDLSQALLWTSCFAWCADILVDNDICSTLISLIMYVTYANSCSSKILISSQL